MHYQIYISLQKHAGGTEKGSILKKKPNGGKNRNFMTG